MKRITIMICMLILFLAMKGQNVTNYTNTRNYTAEKTYLDATSQTGDGARAVHDITYTDGFGRKWQEIQISGSPSGTSDLMVPHEYATLGQVEKEYLPYVKEVNNGAFDANMFESSHWNIYGTEEQDYAFTYTQYEASPLMRVVKHTGPGKAWHTNEKSVNTTYGININEEVKLYKVSPNGTLIAGEYYKEGTLQKTTVTDEDGHRTETFTNNNELTVLTVTIDGNERMQTYYVYDDHNQLRYILPPKISYQLEGTTTINTSALEKLSYYYAYDKYNRIIIKRLPGCQPVYMVYDQQDRVVLIQNGKQRVANVAKWSYFIYDTQNRAIENGEIILSSMLSHNQLQQAAWNSENYMPTGTRTALQYIVYDNYRSSNVVTAHPFKQFNGYNTQSNPSVSGLKTSVKLRVIGTDEWMTETTYYDFYSRPIQTICSHPQKGLSYTNMTYDFTGNVLKQQKVIGTNTMETVYTYDNRGRMLTKTNTWDGKATDNITYEYDAVGRMINKKYGGKPMESLVYNIRGWTTEIQSPYFSQTVHYTDGTGTPCYNGNISSIKWKAGMETTARGYKFTYDGLSRLKNAVYGEGDNLTSNVNRFNEQVTGYDSNGNILGLSRYGQTGVSAYGLIDNLNLTYNGNQLKSVKDNATSSVYGNGFEFKDGANVETEYIYDENGNLTKDLNKKITTIQYNCLDLPSKIQFESGNSINYLYLADGTKFRTTHATGSNTVTTDYYKNAIYENGVMVKVFTENGYITVNDSKFHYFIQDHQGNNRVVVDKDGKVEEVNHYYPFGGLFANSPHIQPYKYNGKELDRGNGLDWLDYGARQYDPTIGRWHVVDPSGEKYVNWGLYTYCKNNPIIRIDLDGKDDYVLNRNGAIYMMRKTDRIVDVLYASGINGPKATQPEPNWKSIRVFDKSLLKGLEKNKGKYTLDRMLYTTTNSAYDAVNVFLFAENNTNVEWTLKGGYMDGKKTFILGTDNNENRVTGIYGLTKVENALFPNFKPIFDIHSHPYTPEAAEADMNISKLLLDVKYSIYFRNDQKIIGYDQENSMTYSIKINSMKDLITYILQQFK